MNDEIFLIHIITEICDYAVENQMEPKQDIEPVHATTGLVSVSAFGRERK